MKAERRHTLQTNTLATKLVTLPDIGKKYGRWAVVVVIAAGLVAILILTRYNNAQAEKQRLRSELGDAQEIVTKFSNGRSLPGIAESARPLLDDVVKNSDDSSILAQAWVLQGDLNWSMYNFPPLAASATQPSLRPDMDRPELIRLARDAYQKVLDLYPTETLSATAARFGLAAIAETTAATSSEPEENWKQARQYYNQVLQTLGLSEGLKQVAQQRLDQMKDLERVPLIGDVAPEISPTTAASFKGKAGTTTASTFPTTLPVTMPATTPATTRPSAVFSPATAASSPATVPVTAPATLPH